MKKKLNLILIVSVLAIVFGIMPKSVFAEDRYSKTCASWVGININKLVHSWGYPQRSFRAPNGNKVYVYTRTKKIPKIFNDRTNAMIESLGPYYCTTFFETDDKGIIIYYRYEGNRCN